MRDRLEILEKVLQQDGFAPETLRALQLILEELEFQRGRTDELMAAYYAVKKATGK